MRRTTIYLIAFGFIAFISVPLVLHLFGFGETESVQNRVLEPPSVPVPADLIDTDYYEQVRTYIRDTFPLRKEAVVADAEIDLAMGDSPNPVVTIGKDGWLYYTPTLEATCYSDRHIARAVEQIQLMHGVVVASGRSFLFAVSPDKAGIYPEHVPDGADNGCRDANRSGFLEELQKTGTGAFVIAPWDDLSAAKADAVQYFESDTHWTNRGALVMAEGIVDAFAPDQWDSANIETSAGEALIRDLTALLGLQDLEADEDVRVVRPATTVERSESDVGEASIVESHAIGGDPVVDAPIAIIRDSFFSRVEPHVAPFFSQMRTTEQYDLEADSASALLVDSEIIVVESVERAVYRRLLSGLGDRMMVALIGDLDTTELAITSVDDLTWQLVSDEPTVGQYIVIVGEPADQDLQISGIRSDVVTVPFSNGYAVIRLSNDPINDVTVVSPASLRIENARLVRLH